MTAQISLFDVKENNIKDIRTDAQINRTVAYDVGEKIGGARKDEFALRKAFEDNKSIKNLRSLEKYSVVAAAELVNKKELFKTFSLENEKDKGADSAIARIKQLIIQRIKKSPEEDSAEGRESYLRAANFILDEMDNILILDDLVEWVYSIRKHLNNERLNLSYARKMVQDSKDILSSNETDQNVLARAKKTHSIYVDVIKESEKAKELPLSCLGDKFTNFFKNAKSANTTINNVISKVENWEDLLVPKKTSRKKSSNKPAWKREFPERPDRIGGGISNVRTPEDLMNKFGFRGIEFGHWANDVIAMDHLFRSSEAFLDLIDVLRMNHNYSISFNGSLAMAYGSRGRGASLAHYESGNKVINLTRNRGALGVTAHEWFHGLDNWLYDISYNFKNGMTGYLSTLDNIGAGISPFIVDAFNELLKAIKEGNSISYIENTNQPNTRWRLSSVIVASYRNNNKNFEATMKELKEVSDERLEERLRFISSFYNNQEKEEEKAIKKTEREFKKMALALAFLHEDETGERLDKIPFPTNNTRFFNKSIELDRKNVGKYWSSNIELAARAFEAYVSDKLDENERKNDYLVCGTHDPIAFPTEDEREKINNCFDILFVQIRKSGLL